VNFALIGQNPILWGSIGSSYCVACVLHIRLDYNGLTFTRRAKVRSRIKLIGH